jgi:dynein heavy chain
MAYVDTLPLIDAPDVFGLHENANITFQKQQTKRMCSTLIAMVGGGSSGGGSSNNDEKVIELAKAFAERFPPLLDDDDAHPSTYARIEDGSVNSVGVVCSQEIVRFNNLRRAVEKHLVDLQKAIVGTIVMSLPMEVLYNCFVFNTLPDAWGEDGAGYPSLKPLSSWSNDFIDRLKFIGSWLTEGPPNTFCISYFFFPQGFMTGVKQTFSRKTQIAIDILTFKTNVTRRQPDSVTLKPSVGVYIHGAFMQGARFNQTRMMMAESIPGTLFDVMPVIHLEPIKKEEYDPANVYDIPFYKTSRRAGTLSTTGHSTNFVMSLKIPSKKSQDHWIRRGVALLSMLDD